MSIPHNASIIGVWRAVVGLSSFGRRTLDKVGVEARQSRSDILT